jgi:hypothetical protein
MPKYAISFVSFFENELKMEVVEASNELDALREAYNKVHGNAAPEDITDIKELKAVCFDMDSLISAIEILNE